MDKIKLIIHREYMTKIKSRTFILLTILGPILYLGLIFGSVLLSKVAEDDVVGVTLVDKSGLFVEEFAQQEHLAITYEDFSISEIEGRYNDGVEKGTTVYIPANIGQTKAGVKLYFIENPGLSTIDKIKSVLNQRLRDQEMQLAGINKEKAESIQKLRASIDTIKMGDKGASKGSTAAASGLAFGSALLLYLFIFLYGSMVLRGVQEEKTSRISEVIISSVKPFQLMMGKIIGNALLGFTQFAIWIVLAIGGSLVVGALFPEMVQGLGEGMMANQPMPGGAAAVMHGQDIDAASLILKAVADFNILEVVFYFIIYFLGGYLLYSSLFAAIAAAVDGQQDLQQFMFPIIIPLILGMVMMPSVLQNPNNPLAVFFSIFPLTSPIVMMARIPFEVVWYQKLISVVVLVLTFLGAVWVSGKIYRVGLLSYGSKPSWKQMIKWLTYKG